MDIYVEYAKTRLQIAALTGQMKDLEERIIREIKSLSSPMRNEYGTYTAVKRNVYRLSKGALKEQDYIKNQIRQMTEPLLMQIKEVEKRDIESGKAKREDLINLRFTENKKIGSEND